MAWKLVTVHRVAHIEPTGSLPDTTTTGYSSGSIGTLNLRDRTRFIGAQDYVFDRGSTASGIINCALILSHNLAAQSYTYQIKQGAASPPATSQTGPTAPAATNADIFVSFSGSTSRYWSVTFATGTNGEIGCVSLGQAYDIGGVQWPYSFGQGANEVGNTARTINATFRNVTQANATTILYHMGHRYDWKTASSEPTINGVAGRRSDGRQGAIALVDPDNVVYFGIATVSAQYFNNRAELSVSLTEAEGVRPTV